MTTTIETKLITFEIKAIGTVRKIWNLPSTSCASSMALLSVHVLLFIELLNKICADVDFVEI